MTARCLPPPSPSPYHKTLAESAYSLSLALPDLSPGEIIVAGTLGGECRRIANGQTASVEDLDTLADEADRLYRRTGIRAARELHEAVVALSIELDRQRNPAPAGYITAGRRGPSRL